jgi:hypothetical protein
MKLDMQSYISIVARSVFIGTYGTIYTDTYYDTEGEEVGDVSYQVKHGQEIRLTELPGNSFTYPSVQVEGGEVEEDLQSEEYPDTSDINF